MTAAASTLEQRVAVAVEIHREQLRDLVRRAVDAELDSVVDEEIAARGNGVGSSTADNMTAGENDVGDSAKVVLPHADAPDTEKNTIRRCTSCGRHLPADRFQRHRRQCRSCRNRYQAAQRRERRAHGQSAQEAVADGPHPAAASGGT